MSKLKKFTSLPQEKVTQIISQSKAIIPPIAARVENVITQNPNHKILIGAYQAATDKKEFLNNNLQAVTAFLNECELIGHPGEKGDLTKNTYVLGMDGAALLISYQATKEKNADSHPVQAIKNNPVAPNGSRKMFDNYWANQATLPTLKKQLVEDLAQAGEDKFEKTYVVETFGTTGGDHVLSLTVRKNAGEKDPLIHLFDSSNSLIRNGLEACKNSIAGGWCSQITINATLKAALEETGLIFNEEKYFNNSEPLQRSGSSLCATFAYETAYEFAAMSREEHLAHLQGYQYDSPFGGKTERPVDINNFENGYLPAGPSALPVEKIPMTHFTDTGLKPRIAELAATSRKTKRGEETLLKRVERYQSDDGENQLAEQKGLRQKIGHLFEIVTNAEFLEKAEGVEYVASNQPRENPYNPAGADFQKPPLVAAGLIKELNRILPVSNRVNRCEMDEEAQTCTAIVYLGQITGDKLERLMREKGIDIQPSTRDLSDKLVGVNPQLSQLREVKMVFPRERLTELEEGLKAEKPLSSLGDHQFMPPKATVPIRGVEQLQVGQVGLVV